MLNRFKEIINKVIIKKSTINKPTKKYVDKYDIPYDADTKKEVNELIKLVLTSDLDEAKEIRIYLKELKKVQIEILKYIKTKLNKNLTGIDKVDAIPDNLVQRHVDLLKNIKYVEHDVYCIMMNNYDNCLKKFGLILQVDLIRHFDEL